MFLWVSINHCCISSLRSGGDRSAGDFPLLLFLLPRVKIQCGTWVTLFWSVPAFKAFQEQSVFLEKSAFAFLLERNQQKSQLLPTAPFKKIEYHRDRSHQNHLAASSLSYSFCWVNGSLCDSEVFIRKLSKRDLRFRKRTKTSSLANTDVGSKETVMVKNDPKEQTAHRVSKEFTSPFRTKTQHRKTLIAAPLSILRKTGFCHVFLLLLFICIFLLYCSTQVWISASPWLQVLHLEIQSSLCKKKTTKKQPKWNPTDQKKPKQTNNKTKTPTPHHRRKTGSDTVQL